MEPNNFSNFKPPERVMWFLHEGFRPLGVVHVKTGKDHWINVDFSGDNQNINMRGPYVKEVYDEVKRIIKYWDSLELDDEFYGYL